MALDARANDGYATLMILVDQSGSMPRHSKKLVSVASILKEVLKKSFCRIKVSVSNIQYEGYTDDIYLKPWGDPAFLDVETPMFEELVAERIKKPFDAHYIRKKKEIRNERGFAHVPSRDHEITYSSLAASIKSNLPELYGSNVVGTILLSDAVPAYETLTPGQAYSQILHAMGARTPYLSAIIGPELYESLNYQGYSNFQYSEPSTGDSNGNLCEPDHAGPQIVGQAINTSSWKTPNINGITEFTNMDFSNKFWNICKDNYDIELKLFVDQVLMMGECIPSM